MESQLVNGKLTFCYILSPARPLTRSRRWKSKKYQWLQWLRSLLARFREKATKKETGKDMEGEGEKRGQEGRTCSSFLFSVPLIMKYFLTLF